MLDSNGGGYHRRHAAWPRITGPSRVTVGTGTQPRSIRASSNSSADGRWSQTATAVVTPNQVHS